MTKQTVEKENNKISITEKVTIKAIYREVPVNDDSQSTTTTTTTTKTDNGGKTTYTRDVTSGSNNKISYGLFDDTLPSCKSSTTKTTTKQGSKTMTCTQKPRENESKDLHKSYSKGVAYGLFDKNNGKFKRGVGYSLFDKSFTEQKDHKFEVKKGQYGTYNKRAEMINLQVDEDAKMRPLDFEKGTYFTFGRMKEHLFFRSNEPYNRNRHNNNCSENESEKKLEDIKNLEVNQVVVKLEENMVRKDKELDLESQMARLSLEDVKTSDK